MAMTSELHLPSSLRELGVRTALAVAGVLITAALVARLDTGPALVVLVGAVAAVTVWVSPGLATVTGVFLLYANLPAALREDVPNAHLFAASFAIPLAVPFLHRLIKGARPVFDLTFALMVAYLLVLLASAFLAVDWRVAVLKISQYAAEGVALYWLLLQAVRTRTALRRVAWTIAITGALLGSLALYQQVSGDFATQFSGMAQRQLRHDIAAANAAAAGEEGSSAGSQGNAPVRTSHRAAGPMGDPNRFAQILLVGLPWAIFLAFRARAIWARRAGAVAAALILAGIGLTYSRGAFVTMALLLVALAIWRLVRPRQLLATVAVAAVVVVALAPNYVKRMGTIANSRAIISDRPNVNPDGAIKGRATELLAALWVFADHPILGVGPGQYTPYYSQAYQQRPDIKFRALSQPREAHNLFVSVAAETGIIGLGLFLAIFVSLIVRLRRLRRYWVGRDAELAALATVCVFSLLAYLGTGLFLHLAYERYLALMLGMAGATVQIMYAEMRRNHPVPGGVNDRAR